MAFFTGRFQSAEATPDDGFAATVVPVDSAEHFTTLTANNNLSEAVVAAVTALFAIGTGLYNTPEYQFLEKAFIKAFNAFYEKKEKYLADWNATIGEGTELQRVREKQMIELLGQPLLEKFVPEIAQFAITKISVHGGRRLEFEFVDGTKKKASI